MRNDRNKLAEKHKKYRFLRFFSLVGLMKVAFKVTGSPHNLTPSRDFSLRCYGASTVCSNVTTQMSMIKLTVPGIMRLRTFNTGPEHIHPHTVNKDWSLCQKQVRKR